MTIQNKRKLVFREETTEWSVDVYGQRCAQNHIYVFENKQLIGYVKNGTKKVHWMKSPSRQWSPKGRTFRYLKDSEVSELIF